MAIGFWFPQNLNPYLSIPESETPSLEGQTFSVSEIEQMTGGEFNFFPTIPETVKKIKNIADWLGLAGIM